MSAAWADRPEEEIREYGDDKLGVRRGHVNAWLLVVYVALTAWAIYYLIKYWGGLGPGLQLGP